MPFALINDISGTWSFGGHFCKLWIATDVMSSTASIANLLAISLDRFVEELKRSRSWKSLSVNNEKTSSGLDGRYYCRICTISVIISKAVKAF